MLKRLKEVIWPEQRKTLIEGREIAGNIMLETIFDLLRSWTDTNLKSFLIQLNQFFQIYGNPFVYEDTQRKWHSLDYGEDDVSSQQLCTNSRWTLVWSTQLTLFVFLVWFSRWGRCWSNSCWQTWFLSCWGTEMERVFTFRIPWEQLWSCSLYVDSIVSNWIMLSSVGSAICCVYPI